MLPVKHVSHCFRHAANVGSEIRDTLTLTLNNGARPEHREPQPPPLHLHATHSMNNRMLLFFFFLWQCEVKVTKSQETELWFALLRQLDGGGVIQAPLFITHQVIQLSCLKRCCSSLSFQRQDWVPPSRWSWIILKGKCFTQREIDTHTYIDVQPWQKKKHGSNSGGMLLGGIGRMTLQVCPGIGRRGSCHGNQQERRGEMEESKNCSWLSVCQHDRGQGDCIIRFALQSVYRKTSNYSKRQCSVEN